MAVDDDLFVEAEDHFAVARAAATPEAGLRAGRAQVHECRRVGNRELLQQHMMEPLKRFQPSRQCRARATVT